MTTPVNEKESVGADFNGLSVAAFESRQSCEMEDLIRRNGGVPHVAPSMREVPLTENREAYAFFDRLSKSGFDLVIFMTGIGARTLFQALETRYPKEDITRAFGAVPLCARGPKSVKALTDNGLHPAVVAAEPNTWREVLSALRDKGALKGARVAVQEYGVSNPAFLEALREEGASEVRCVPVYRWALPEDVQPLVELIGSILRGEQQVALFTSANQVNNVFHVAKGLGQEERLRAALSGMVIGSIGGIATEGLGRFGLTPDLEPLHPKMGFLVKETSAKAAFLLKAKGVQSVRRSPSPAPPVGGLEGSLFLKACRREPVERTPLWIMRQAGRYLPEYRKVRSQVSFLELCKTPELAAEVTVSAQETLGVDAAILFADILLIAEPLGFQLEFAESGGPVIRNPFRSPSDLDRLREVDIRAGLGYVLDAVELIRSRLAPGIPLIGFAGAPFTLASYLVEGGGSKDHARTLELLGKDPATWSKLMDRIVPATVSYLNAQVAAGAQAVQLFDSWVGILPPEAFESRVLPYLKRLIAGLVPGVPVIYFGTKTEPFFRLLPSTGATVIGVDWRTPLDEAWDLLGGVAVQGNLDPNTLLTDPLTVKMETEKVLRLAGGRPGHIFNLGHGILPNTPMENVRAMIDTVKNWKIEK